MDRPVVRDGRIVARPMLPLTLTFDHAVIDGAPAPRFVETLRDLTETAAVFENTHARPDPSHPPMPPHQRYIADLVSANGSRH